MGASTRTFAVKAGKFVLPGRLAGAGYLTVIDGCFGAWSAEAPEGLEVVDRTGSWVAPGYVDTHIHGFAGHDVMDCDPEGINAASMELARRGTTSWIPTTLTQPADEIAQACASVYEAGSSRPDDFVGARIEGIFLEGPFFTEAHAGAQNPSNMLDPDVDVLCGWQDEAHGLICKSAIAPERAGSELYCARLNELGVVVALGHSDAGFDEAMAAVSAGATVFVHTYNGMSGLHHRNPGMVGAAMASTGTYAELICDGMHVRPGAVAALVAAKGWERVVLISDCLRCGGMTEGDYMLGDFSIRVTDGLARLVMKDGTLGNIAGSTCTLAQAVRNVADWGVVTAEQAIRMASEVAADSCGVDDVCGRILPGRAADFNVLDRDLAVVETYVGGRPAR